MRTKCNKKQSGEMLMLEPIMIAKQSLTKT